MSAAPKILVVDDDATHLLLTRELLEAEGYEVQVHQSAFGATERIIQHAPDLVLMDVNMPALSGEGLVGVLRRREWTRDVRVLLHSSNDEHALRASAERLGIDGYVPKGDPALLRRRVAEALRGRPPGGPAARRDAGRGR
ncbi:response regulator [Anaeromyxobacter dehalogenans]|uniref:Response regulator receiver domain protein (CheY-like) n=1 Tax=Anaeromyxobacter dehalogenans (strain 2CP-C) TaxID=290397 RepID=Q2IPM9_ANADE|nr:response regulator [Anaeromyxobacter dehalogenans]ABC80759.1 response regulator receiver domain protein (CheY-like) [Anaeromyxobacter dehalogenans 2CP-C]